jgi:hypothetical protein
MIAILFMSQEYFCMGSIATFLILYLNSRTEKQFRDFLRLNPSRKSLFRWLVTSTVSPYRKGEAGSPSMT